MHATFACGNAVQASAKIDHFGEHGRVRGDLLLFAIMAPQVPSADQLQQAADAIDAAAAGLATCGCS